MRKAGVRMSTQSIIMLMFIAIGLVCAIWGGILTILEHRRKHRMPYYDIERLIKASNAHWQYCVECERWWFTHRKTCARCTDTLETPHEDVLREFMVEFLAFWNAITEAGMKRPYPEQPLRIFSENEVAGLMWTKIRAEKARK